MRGDRLSRLTTTWLVSLALLAPVAAAESRSDSPLNSPSYAREHWLPMSVVTALAQDTIGYLWVGTSSGLVRFDGSQFFTWGTQSDDLLPSNNISGVLVSRDASSWVRFFVFGGVSRMDG